MILHPRPALIIFARNPVAGRVKTRLAKDAGPEAALQAYIRLLRHTAQVAAAVSCTRFVYYDETITMHDDWNETLFEKRLQTGADLGQRMRHAFATVLERHSPAVIIGTDCYELRPRHIETAFERLQAHDAVAGPAVDGGYYLLGMNTLHAGLFENIEWSSEKVLEQTLAKATHLQLRTALLEVLHDVDTAADAARYPGLL